MASKSKKSYNSAHDQELDKAVIETREEMYDRLKNGSEYNPENVVGRMVGTVDNPVVLTKTIGFDDACADLFRSQDEDKHDDPEEGQAVTRENDGNDSEHVGIPDEMIFKPQARKGDLPGKWISKR